MRITPIDIQQQQFRSRLMGYDKAGVDQFLEVLAGEIERLFRQNQDLQEELARTKSTLADMRERETNLKETLLTTQKVTDELKANARREAELVLTDAEMRAERVMRNAEDRRLQLIEEIQEIKRQKIDFETSLRSLLEKHVRMLDLNILSISEDKAEAKLLEEPLPFDRQPPSAVPARIPEESAAAAAPAPVRPAPVQAAPVQAAAEEDDLTFDIPLISDPERKPTP
ncbi:MAG: DivIVA domain-containing protein [Desulfuromonadales bacterium]|nr:DivIVA domain-containing protein [Desulfuromonadales bacterium]